MNKSEIKRKSEVISVSHCESREIGKAIYGNHKTDWFVHCNDEFTFSFSSIVNRKSYFVIHFLLLTFLSLFIISCNNITDNTSNTPSSKVSPKNNAKLNYTQVMFEYPEIKNAIIYKIQIAEDIASDNFENSIIIEQKDSTTATLINGLKFAKKYQWRYFAINKKGDIIFTSSPYYFETLNIDKNFRRYKIIKKEVNDGLIFLDSAKVAINREGNPVWFMPDKFNKRLENIEITKSGTITFLLNRKGRYNENGIEMSLDGNVLWETPHNGIISGDSTEYYHHNFKKLDNGNYMILGCKYIKPKKNVNAEYILYGTIIEYDSEHNIVWSWNSQKYFADNEIYYPPNEINNEFYVKNKKPKLYDPIHLNAFYYDEKNDFIYISLRHKNKIIKIDKKTNKVIANIEGSGDKKNTNNLFKYQHSPILLPNGNIAVFNNNNIGNEPEKKNTHIASVVVLSQPNSINGNSKIIWEFKCNFDSLYGGYSYRQGNINYLDNSNFLVNMGYPISRLFEVTQDKKIVWDCYAEKYSVKQKKWINASNYSIFYTKSLYPVYFTLTNLFNTDKNNLHLTFKINNEGSNSDKYLIKYYANNKEIESIATEELLPNKTKSITLNINNLKIKNQKITVIVTSLANPDFKRELKYNVQ